MSRGWLIGGTLAAAALAAVPALAGPSGAVLHRHPRPPHCTNQIGVGQGQTFFHISKCDGALKDVRIKVPNLPTGADFQAASGQKTRSGKCEHRKHRHLVECPLKPVLRAQSELLIGVTPQIEPGGKVTESIVGANGGILVIHSKIVLTPGCTPPRFFQTAQETKAVVGSCQYPLTQARLTFTTPESATFTLAASSQVVGQGTCGGGGTPTLICVFDPPLAPATINSVIFDVTPPCTTGSYIEFELSFLVRAQMRTKKLGTFSCPTR